MGLNKKIRIAFIKFGGLAAAGTERWLQYMAANLPKDEFEVDYYYCNSFPYFKIKGSETNRDRFNYMREKGVNLIQFTVKKINSDCYPARWEETDFWDVFDSRKYDFVQTGKAGAREYPYFKINLPVIEFVALTGGVDHSPNIVYSIHPSDWQRSCWTNVGGRIDRSCVIPVPVEEPASSENFREELEIPEDALVAGYHQRNNDEIYSQIPLDSFSKIYNPDRHFIIMGGSQLYRKQAEESGLKNVHFLDHSGDAQNISKFLNTLDIFAHGRFDGETFGTVFAEAMIHGKPCLSHSSVIGNNAHKETMGSGGLFAETADDYTVMLDRLYTDKELRNELGANAYQIAKNSYTLPSCVEALRKLYLKIYEEMSNKTITVPVVDNANKRPLIYDCFTFLDELELLELRLDSLNETVDWFIIVESAKTYDNLPKPLYYQENQDLFARYADKIMYMVVNKFPADSANVALNQSFHRNCLSVALKECSIDDVIIISDVSEIPDPDKIKGSLNIPGIKVFEQKQHNVNPKLTTVETWLGSLMLEGRDLISIDELIEQRNSGTFTKIENGGWVVKGLGGC
ncbi:MAG: hypothetical protein A2287_07720 [Candidatus Melainabacteria bacterium RIFOXYA12_FULL_32_12]|nr:MAG: hypothetical protein A2255_00440 [Candidatus Melainabacteria bacterium RIFOXYA2_FULL_32_9]OGI25799.1 MAG: hypothetical protein A2287_07720 [Candidatus Melainabacteria bacterium RIFOXYA12_FULL_32_12]